jgi:hypothetical protein
MMMSTATPALDAANIRLRSGMFMSLNSGTLDADGDGDEDVPAFGVASEALLLVMVGGIDDGGAVDDTLLDKVLEDISRVVVTDVPPPNVDPGTDMSNAGLYSNLPLASSMILSPYLFPAGIVLESS